MPVTAGDGTTHAEPRRAARLIGTATPSLVRAHRAVRYFRSVTGVRRPTCELTGRETSETRKSDSAARPSRKARVTSDANAASAAFSDSGRWSAAAGGSVAMCGALRAAGHSSEMLVSYGRRSETGLADNPRAGRERRAGDGAQLLVGARGTHREGRACCKRLLT